MLLARGLGDEEASVAGGAVEKPALVRVVGLVLAQTGSFEQSRARSIAAFRYLAI